MRRKLASFSYEVHRRLSHHPFWLTMLQRLRGYHAQVIALDYPVDVKHPRYGYSSPPHAGLIEIFNANRQRIIGNLDSFAKLRPFFDNIPVESTSSNLPFWENGWLPPLDGVALYGFLASRNPARYLEIGSGNSTKFARKAIDDHHLRTEITSIDPQPRAQVDALCDRSMRVPFENVDREFYSALESGDVVFFDGSHRCFTNSDVTVFFLEVLPALKPGVLVHVHDIYLPYDYPPNTPYYSEQYLLAAYILAGAALDIEMPNSFVSNDPALREVARRALPREETKLPSTATSFWFSKRG